MITIKRTSKVDEVDDKMLEKVSELIYPDNFFTEDKPKTKKGRKKKDVSI